MKPFHAVAVCVVLLVAAEAEAKGPRLRGKAGLGQIAVEALVNTAARAAARNAGKAAAAEASTAAFAEQLEPIDQDVVNHVVKARDVPPAYALPTGPSADELERSVKAEWEAKQQRAMAGVKADVDRVLARALNDYPVLKTPAGSPVLDRIIQRQRVLTERGMYPSIAMVEAVADYAADLAPREAFKAPPQAPAAEPESPPRQIAGCRWISPVIWSCK